MFDLTTDELKIISKLDVWLSVWLFTELFEGIEFLIEVFVSCLGDFWTDPVLLQQQQSAFRIIHLKTDINNFNIQ